MPSIEMPDSGDALLYNYADWLRVLDAGSPQEAEQATAWIEQASKVVRGRHLKLSGVLSRVVAHGDPSLPASDLNLTSLKPLDAGSKPIETIQGITQSHSALDREGGMLWISSGRYEHPVTDCVMQIIDKETYMPTMEKLEFLDD